MRNTTRQIGIHSHIVLTPIIKYMAIFLIAVHFISCKNLEKATYFNDLGDAEFTESVGNLEPVLQKNDILSITVSSLNVEAAEMFNVVNTYTRAAQMDGLNAESNYRLEKVGGNILGMLN